MKFREYIVLDEDDEVLDNWDNYVFEDYINYELVDDATGEIIMSGDNIHHYINFAIDNFLSGAAYSQDSVIVEKYIRKFDGTEEYCYTIKF